MLLLLTFLLYIYDKFPHINMQDACAFWAIHNSKIEGYSRYRSKELCDIASVEGISYERAVTSAREQLDNEQFRAACMEAGKKIVSDLII